MKQIGFHLVINLLSLLSRNRKISTNAHECRFVEKSIDQISHRLNRPVSRVYLLLTDENLIYFGQLV